MKLDLELDLHFLYVRVFRLLSASFLEEKILYQVFAWFYEISDLFSYSEAIRLRFWVWKTPNEKIVDFFSCFCAANESERFGKSTNDIIMLRVDSLKPVSEPT
jgi:hypothetical protein